MEIKYATGKRKSINDMTAEDVAQIHRDAGEADERLAAADHARENRVAVLKQALGDAACALGGSGTREMVVQLAAGYLAGRKHDDA